uniref:Glutamine--fructose-6-phosphate aminotransferase [isomerizing] n=1 Tax=Trepomonas sp. PC1 TaxID=1076344 RepID=A0A146KMZ9_9EUKA|eukprot:JAP96439.1 Glutamine--fructose-6-phosphate aminotransferase [isomerizing] [Trepomonas sp. PC1]
MCGIIGILSTSPVMKKLMHSLQTLEYRGYDSAGIALFYQNAFKLFRAAGKLQNLQQKLVEEECNSGIGHTRWATHGGATEANAHPHIAGDVVVVHNGIIENFAELRNELEEIGVGFSSETDTEVICQLISFYFQQSGNKLESITKALKRFRGSFAFLVAFKDAPQQLFAVCKGSPLVFGQRTSNEKLEFFVSSDALAIAGWAQQFVYMKSGEIMQMDQLSQKIKLTNFDLEEQSVCFEENRLNAEACSKQGYPHFMLKEIFEQPRAIAQSILAASNLFQEKKKQILEFFSKPVTLIACGTSFHACMMGKYFLEKYARIKCDCELASEFLYRSPIIGGSYIFISQSGETRDTLAAFDMVKESCQSLSIVNVPTSQLARNSSLTFVTQAGYEIGVASTKAFTAQLTVLMQIISQLCNNVQISSDLSSTSFKLGEFMQFVGNSVKNISAAMAQFKSLLYLGRGCSYPVALEGALKMKELCYIHAEGYAAGELKHGPIALIDETMPVLVFVSEQTLEKVLNNVQEVAARNGKLIIICSVSCKEKFDNVFQPISLSSSQKVNEVLQKIQFIEHPDASEAGEVLYQSVIQQLIAYYTAVELGVDVDQPRNLAKCVTVE